MKNKIDLFAIWLAIIKNALSERHLKHLHNKRDHRETSSDLFTDNTVLFTFCYYLDDQIDPRDGTNDPGYFRLEFCLENKVKIELYFDEDYNRISIVEYVRAYEGKEISWESALDLLIHIRTLEAKMIPLPPVIKIFDEQHLLKQENIEKLKLSRDLIRLLRDAGISSIEELSDYTEEELCIKALMPKNRGFVCIDRMNKHLKEIKDALGKRDLAFACKNLTTDELKEKNIFYLRLDEITHNRLLQGIKVESIDELTKLTETEFDLKIKYARNIGKVTGNKIKNRMTEKGISFSK